MKRLFQRAASSSASSPDSAHDDRSPSKQAAGDRTRRSYSPERIVAALRKKNTSPEKEKRAPQEGKRPASASISDDNLHNNVVEYTTTTTAVEAQDTALRAIHTAMILEDDTGGRRHMCREDAERLLGECSRRLRLVFQRQLEEFHSTSVMQQESQETRAFELHEEAERVLLTLDVVKELLCCGEGGGDTSSKRVALVVSERLPSTLVKVLKAFCHANDQSSSDAQEMAAVFLAVLTQLVHFPETIQQLVETSTMHRLFYLTFNSPDTRLLTLQLIETMVISMEDAQWDSMWPRLTDHRCLLELLAMAVDGVCLEKVLRIASRILRAAYDRDNLAVHKQLRGDQFYAQVFSVFETIFRQGDLNDDEVNDQQQAIREAIGELCTTGSDTTAGGGGLSQSDKCFEFAGDAPSMRSFLNVEAFALLCQVIEFLHIEGQEQVAQSALPDLHEPSIARRHSLECQYIQKIGRLVVENRFDYILIRRSGMIDVLVRRLHELPELAKHAVGSVLAAVAIEANVIPYNELTTITSYLDSVTQSTSTKSMVATSSSSNNRSSELTVLLLFVGNLLRFHDRYHRILRATDVLRAVVTLFQSQTTLCCSADVVGIKINVAYPTSVLKMGQSHWRRRYSPMIGSDDDEAAGTGSGDWVLPVNEKNLVMFLSSHCRQSSIARKNETSHAVERRVFTLILELLAAFADDPVRSEDEENDDGDDLASGLCELPFLECLCVVLADKQYQEQALHLWMAILRIALRSKTQNTTTYNTINCFLQSIRYVALALYYQNEPGVAFAFHGSAALLCHALSFLEELLRPAEVKNAAATTSTMPGRLALTNSNRDRLLTAIVDSDGLFTCLATTCSLIRTVSSDRSETGEIGENSDTAIVVVMQLIHLLMASNANVTEQFNSSVTYRLYGDLIHEYLANNDDQRQSHEALCSKILLCLLGLTVNDYDLATRDEMALPGVTALRIVHPGAFTTFLQLLTAWAMQLRSTFVNCLLQFATSLLETPENALVCMRVNLCDVLLRCFAIEGANGSNVDGVNNKNSLRFALLDPASMFHAPTLSMLKSAASGGVSHTQARRWIKLIAHAASRSPGLVTWPLLHALTELAYKATTSNAPAIRFDASRDGFAQMQIPEVLVRSHGSILAAYHASGQSATSTAAALTAAKVWPPTDGYTVMTWIRIDASETKDEREKQYWDLLMTNHCVLCHNVLREETALKCSHRACRACHDALINCGGECVVCNPPMFYLFRFRSGDAKSVSELFLRGSRLCMRTSAATKTAILQFTHPPLQLGRWYHVAIAHSKQRFQSSHVSLYLDGLLQETVKMSFPSSIGSGQPLSGLVGIPSQARRLSSSRWMLGPFYLIDDALSAHLINCVFAAGPSYGELFLGTSGSNEVLVAVDHLTIDNLLLLDEYTRDPIRTLLESVEAAERTSKSSILRGSLSLASAASSAAAAIVQDIKAKSSSTASIFARVPSPVPFVSVPVSQDRILLAYSSDTAVGIDFSVVPSGKLDGRPLAQLLGGAEVVASFSLADTLHDLSGSGTRFTYALLEQAASQHEVELVLELLWHLMRSHSKNLVAMEGEHGYGVINYLLHNKTGDFLSDKTLTLLFRITGIDIDDEGTEGRGRENQELLQRAPHRESAVRNLLAMQHFILDHSLWQKATTSTQRLLFSTLYACLMANGDEKEARLRERNRAQLESLSLVRQLLYVFLDPTVERDLLRVIADLLLVCLTGGSSNSTMVSNATSNSSSSSSSGGGARSDTMTLEANFAEVASFLASSLSPRFARTRGDTDGGNTYMKATAAAPATSTSRRLSERDNEDTRRRSSLMERSMSSNLGSPVGSTVGHLCLSPRGKNSRSGFNREPSWRTRGHPVSPQATAPTEPLEWRARQTQAQELLLEILTKAVQKHDLKESRERDEVDALLYVDANGAALSSSTTATTIASSTGTSGGGITGSGATQRLQLSTSSSKLSGFRKVLSPRWVGYFIFPTAESPLSVTVSPSTVIVGLKLLAALLTHPRYESVFRKDGYYRLLAQGLPCDHRAFFGSQQPSPLLSAAPSFRFDHVWYTLFCILLGPPVDGMPHDLQFEMFFLTKDFELNLQRDRLANATISCVILALVRRHYNDPVSFASLKTMQIHPERPVLDQVSYALYHPHEPTTTLFHLPVLDFLHNIYETMPAFKTLIVLGNSNSSSGSSGSGNNSTGSSSIGGGGGSSGSTGNSDSKLRGEFLEELSLVICGAARSELLSRYVATEKQILHALLQQKRELTAHEFATCAVQLAEWQACEDSDGDDPFQHCVAQRALKFLVNVLCDFLVLHQKGIDYVESFFESQYGRALAPPLHDGLQLRFQTIVIMQLLEQVRHKFRDESVLLENHAFAPNMKAFMAFAVKNMLMWQRAQHGDACPKPFACCGDKIHFAGGPLALLDVTLFVLGDTGNVTASRSVGASVTDSVVSASSSTTSSLGQLTQDRLSKPAKTQKRRHTLRNMILGKLSLSSSSSSSSSSKSAELEGLTSSMYTTMNAVILHVLHGHGSFDVTDDDCETLLQLIHVHREVVLSPQNSHDKDFYVCLCRFLLQLLSGKGIDSSETSSLQELATQVWIDLMVCQRALMVELLTVEIRRTAGGGGAPYLVNLMKNGFDMLLECTGSGDVRLARTGDGESAVASLSASSQALTESSAFQRFSGWLDIVGPPLVELETHFDRVFVRRMVESKEIVRDGWASVHKVVSQRTSSDVKKFAVRLEWVESKEQEICDTLGTAQRYEFTRQLKWRQDRIDRRKFYARQWHKLRHDLMEQSLRDDGEEEGCGGEDRSGVLLSEIVASSRIATRKSRGAERRTVVWQLDATEGPSRMRKRLIAKTVIQTEEDEEESSDNNTNVAPQEGGGTNHGKRCPEPPSASQLNSGRRQRRYSESDIHYIFARLNEMEMPAHEATEQKHRDGEDATKEAAFTGSVAKKQQLLNRRVSFQNLLRRDEHMSDDFPRTRKVSNVSATSGGGTPDSEDDDDDDDDPEKPLSSSFVSGSSKRRRGKHARSSEDDDSQDAVDEKLRPLLVPGDEILEIYDCLRVDGMDACPGVFILCSDHLYIVDNYQLVVHYGPAALPENGQEKRRDPSTPSSAKVIEVSREAPTRLERRLSLRYQLPSLDGNTPTPTPTPTTTTTNDPETPSSSSLLTVQRSSFTHQCRLWTYDDIVELHKRRHQLRHVAIELFAHDGRNYLITFESPQQRENVFHALIAKCPNVRGAANGMDRLTASSSSSSGGSSDLYTQLRKLLRQNMTERWISHEISNFEYLMHLNTLAGRSYNDLTQYPVFPWVLCDYTSQTLDLQDPSVYRDLSKPMGALFREEEFRMRYESLAEDSENAMNVKPFHFGTHYSSAGIVLHYLMRLEPFTTHFKRLQGGKFDHADRLFASIQGAWKSAAGVDSGHNGTQDVKELVPEFFYLPSFLTNLNHHDFGKDQNGVEVGDVALPPWANGSAREFVRLHREALESQFVSAHLHKWIDLIFGSAQQGPAAVEACNVFYHLTYEGAVDLDAITDVAMRRAMVDQISEFGQTPSQLFKTPHPPRVRLPSISMASHTAAGSASLGSGGGSAPSSGESVGTTGGAGTVVVSSSPPPSLGAGLSLAVSAAASRATLASSFIEGSDNLVSRMHSMLTSSSTVGSSYSSSNSFPEESTVIQDHATMLHQEPRRQATLNPLVAAYRGHHQYQHQQSSQSYQQPPPPMVNMRMRQLSSGLVAAPIRQIAIASASVTRDERVAIVGDHCLLIPPRHHELFAWHFQDRSLKILSTSSSEVASGGDSKVLASFEIAFPISVACMTSDGRTLVAGGAVAPVIRLWQFSSSKKASALSSGSGSSGAGGSSASGGGVSGGGIGGGIIRKRGYSVGLPSNSQQTRSLVPMATLCTPSHGAPITAVQVCRAHSILVSGCANGVAVLWDLNRLRYLRTLASPHHPPQAASSSARSSSSFASVSAITINERTGDIAVASGAVFAVYDVNGELLGRLTQDTVMHCHDTPRAAAITCLTLNRREGSEWCKEKTVITGHSDGVFCIWAYSHSTGFGTGGAEGSEKSEVDFALKGQHMITKPLEGTSGSYTTTTTSRSPVTAVLLTEDEKKLYTGNADGLLSLWTPLLHGNVPTTPTKSQAASASIIPSHPTNLI